VHGSGTTQEEGSCYYRWNSNYQSDNLSLKLFKIILICHTDRNPKEALKVAEPLRNPISNEASMTKGASGRCPQNTRHFFIFFSSCGNWRAALVVLHIHHFLIGTCALL